MLVHSPLRIGWRAVALGLTGAAATLGVGCADVRGLHTNVPDLCYDCHGEPANGNAAPPPIFWDEAAVRDAHQAHLGAADWRAAVDCQECHRVPIEVLDAGHLDTDLPAELVWGVLAVADGATPSWDGTSCTNVYCHGATLANRGDANVAPTWTTVDDTEDACGDGCHGEPPAEPHPQRTACETCHASMDGERHFASPALHINGVVDVDELECDSCHGSNGDPSPPEDTAGNTEPLARGVGAHREHLAPSAWHAAVTCAECHVEPVDESDPGHRDTPLPAELTWGALATADNAAPSFDGSTCSNVYCHGTTLRGTGTANEPVWTLVDGSQAACGSCHGLPPGGGHPARTDCEACHGAVIAADRSFIAPERHIDGTVDVSATLACNACHGNAAGDPATESNWAPPADLNGNTAVSERGVGTHASHLRSTFLHAPVACDECHQVPLTMDEPGHRDTPTPAELTWGPLATTGAVTPQFDGVRCSNTYCHGAALSAGNGNNTTPEWTRLSPPQAACGTCHGLPPGGNHPATSPTDCGPCHPFNTMAPLDRAQHIDGTVQVDVTCGSCHDVPPATGAHAAHYGDNSSPPVALYGDLRSQADYVDGSIPEYVPYYMYGCGNCHPVDPSKHYNRVQELELYDATAPAGSLKAHNPSTARYESGRCSDVYCHSDGRETPTFVDSPPWFGGTLSTPRCANCHANPPRYASGGAGTASANSHVGMADDGWEYGHFGGLPGPWHPGGSRHGAFGAAPVTCQACHYDSVDPANIATDGFFYLDTTGDYDLGGSLGYACATCHTGDIADPPVSEGSPWSKAHVNGTRDVRFDPRTTIPATVPWLPAPPNQPSRPYWVRLSGSAGYLPPGATMDGTTFSAHLGGVTIGPDTFLPTYTSATKTCTNIACHLKQSFGAYSSSITDPLVWGDVPVGNATCNDCHQL